jgi:transcriptional antiterminator RfaH
MTAWYVVYTQPNAEAKALANLRQQGYEGYLPWCRRWRRHARRREIVRRPLFPRYMFVALDAMTTRWRPILSTIGVAGMVRQGDLPLAVPAGVVEQIKNGEIAGQFDELSPVARLAAGAFVRIKDGPFGDLVGRLQSLADGDRVNVLLQLLGREVVARVPVEKLEPA